jgi:hypothetical protein
MLWVDLADPPVPGRDEAVMEDGLSRREAAKRFGVHRNTMFLCVCSLYKSWGQSVPLNRL